MVHGSCLCRSVAWEIEGPLNWMENCHCSVCRRVHGSAFATFVGGPEDGFRWVQGEDRRG